jgi:hypothetical protein
MLLDLVERVRRVRPKLNEVVLSKVGQGTIVLTFDSCSSQAREQQRDFTEEVTLLQRLRFRILLLHMVQHDDIASALGNEVYVIDFLLGALRDNVFLR